MPELITPTEYARRRGVSHVAVGKAIKKGRISTVTGENGRKMIDPAVADIQWARNTDPQQSARANAQKAAYTPPPAGADAGNGSAYWDARTRRETADASRAELELRKLEGELVERRRVEAAAAGIGRMLRDAVLGVPTKLAPDLAHLTDPWEIEQRIAAALRQVLDDITRLTVDDLERAMH